jgi:hypothetical protein
MSSSLTFGWDISTSIIGLSVLDSEGRFVGRDHLDLRKFSPKTLSVTTQLLERADEARPWVYNSIADPCRNIPLHERLFQYHFVEERLSSFASGRTMLQTLMKLAAFNALISQMILDATVEWTSFRINHIHPSTVKSIIRRDGLIIPPGGNKKELTLEFFRKSVIGRPGDLTRTGKPQPWMFDEADAYCVARAGYLRSHAT